MKIPVVWQSFNPKTPARGYWDQAMLEDLFVGKLWRPVGGFEFEHIEGFKSLSGDAEGAVIVFPARSQTEYLPQLNRALKRLKWAILMLTGDEEATFPFERIEHPNLKIWVMSPRRESRYEADNIRFLGTGYQPAASYLKDWPRPARQRTLDWFFAGQITHKRRRQMAEQLNAMLEREDMDGKFVPTDGFTKGLTPVEYFLEMAGAKVAPCPSGPETPDTFRLFEALEAGCIPIADARPPKNRRAFGDDYWTWFFGEEPPFPVLTKYEQLPGYTLEMLKHWKRNHNRVFSWWQQKKRQMACALADDINQFVGARKMVSMLDAITVVIPSSPIQAHPDTAMLEETVAAVRSKLPDSEIIITFDGVRSEQKARRKTYQEYIRRVLWKCNHEWQNVLPVVFERHSHQATMLREALKLVRTPTILYVEHDAPITPDFDFPWESMVQTILEGQANMIRFHHEALVLPEHEPLMLGGVENINGVPMRKTKQWSQRPHLASAAWYRHLLDTYFHPKSRTMIEDVMHGIVLDAVGAEGLMGWYNFRIWLYSPEGNIKRSYHTDGRKSDPKYEMIIKPVKR